MTAAYTGLAEWFEYLNADCDYEKWSQYLYDRLNFLGIAGGKGLEVGCGSGIFCRDFVRRGFSMTGYDVSEEMLTKARRLASEEGVYIEYILCDARRIKVLGGKADFILCVNDCVNYIPQEDVEGFFKKAAGCLRRGGAFLFDVSTAYKLREVIADNCFCEDREEISWMWFNHLQDTKVEMDFTLFIPGKDGRFERKDEHHTQYIHERQALISQAQKAGFEVRAVEGHLGDAKDRMRENFLCIKK